MLQREPVVSGFAGLSGVVAAVLSAAVALGWLDWSAEQVAAVVGVVAAVSAVLAPIVRGRVTPNGTVDSLMFDAVEYADEAWAAGYESGLFTPVPDVDGGGSGVASGA